MKRTAWPGLCALLALGSLAVWAAGLPTGLAWQAGGWVRQPWTLWTAALDHLSAAHMTANLLALGGIALLGLFLEAGVPAALALLLAWPLSTLSLLAWPEVRQYVGLSGLVHAAVGVLWAHAAVRGAPKPASFVLFLALGFKLLLEHAWSQPIGFSPDWGFNVVYAAHLGGALTGAGCGLMAAAVARLRG